MRFKTFTSCLVVAAALSACGGGDSSDPEADQEAIEAAIAAFEEWLEEEGFAVDPDQGEDGDDELEFASEECAELFEVFGDDELPGQTAEADSDDYVRGELDLEGGTSELVEGSLTVVSDADDLDEVFDAIGDERLPECMEDAIATSFEEDSDGEVALDDLEIGDPVTGEVGDESVTIALSGTLAAAGFEVPLEIDLGVARMDQFAATSTVMAIGEDGSSLSVDDALEELLDAIEA